MSVYFEWTNEMSVGERTIDAQHQRLLSQVNKIIEAMMFGATSNEVAEAVNFFSRYIEEHFQYEENYMRRNNYSDLENHKKQHQNFIDKYIDFKNKLDSKLTPDKILLDMEEFLGNWWIEHIGQEDKKYYLAISKIQ